MIIAAWPIWALSRPAGAATLSRMSRVHRHQQPGCVFHITSRTQGHKPWFKERLRSSITETIVDGVISAGATLIAFAVMPNHLHIILAQGQRELGWTMQPVLRRIALLVHRTQGRTGHVFERRFRSKACLDADYVRAAILYTHFNPVKAGICSSVNDYRWTSHSAYCEEGESAQGILVKDVLRLFAADSQLGDRDALRRQYLAHVDWWQRTHHPQPDTKPPPSAFGGTAFFAGKYCTHLDEPATIAAIDLRDRALQLLPLIARDCELDMLRGPYVGRRATAIRKQLIAALLSADYQGTAIADLLKVSPSVVSRVSSQMRWQHASSGIGESAKAQ